jgi:hypothetical protein
MISLQAHTLRSSRWWRVVQLVPAIALLWTLPQVAHATLVKSTPVVVETTGRGESRGFTIAYVGVRDRGPAVLRISERTPGPRGTEQLRRISGTELLQGEQGALTLRWTGAQSQRHGSWGRIVGTWSIASGTGAYEALKGDGRFASDRALRVTRYDGLVVTAV